MSTLDLSKIEKNLRRQKKDVAADLVARAIAVLNAEAGIGPCRCVGHEHSGGKGGCYFVGRLNVSRCRCDWSDSP